MTDMVKATLNNEFTIILPKHRADRPEWYTKQGWEKPRLHELNADIRRQAYMHEQLPVNAPSPVVYYVGAEEGDMCGLVALWGAELVMFEPNPLVTPNIKAIWDANELPQPLAFFEGFAANDTDMKGKDALTFGAFPESAKGKVIGDHGFKELAYESDIIPQIKIDHLVSRGVTPPTLITMDVEGSEFEVLKGAEQTIETFKPIIYLSLHPEFLFRMFNVYSYDVRQWIIGKGYTETLLDYQHEAHFVYHPEVKS